MPEEVKLDPKRGIVEIAAHGDVTISQMEESQRKVAQLLQSQPIRGLLYDGRGITQAPDPDDLFVFSNQTFKQSHFRGIKIAMLIGSSSTVPHMFMAVPARNHKRPMQVFSERIKALEWLDSC